MPQTEQVLIVERKVLEDVGMFNGLTFDVDNYLSAIFTPSVPRFVPRPEAEENPNLKQLIPYVIMACDGKYLTYVRGKRAGEKRLLGNRSIGIGGVSADTLIRSTTKCPSSIPTIDKCTQPPSSAKSKRK
jgi:predicted NUDIX family phosphoesterase